MSTASSARWEDGHSTRAEGDRGRAPPRRWSLRLGAVAGIAIHVHATFLLLVAWVLLHHLAAGHGVKAAGADLLLVGAVFGIVVLHELGHALTARRFGIRTRDITLLPIGGVAQLEGMPERPWQELVVALAGPAVNVALALLLAGALALVGEPWPAFAATGGTLLGRLLWINLTLAIFNLLPAFPMDGGRALRALLTMRLGKVRATVVAAQLGRSIAFLFGILGLFVNPMLILIAVFVWAGAGFEESHVEARAAVAGLPVTAAMISGFGALRPGDPIGAATRWLVAGPPLDFPVVDGDGRLRGLLAREDLLRVLAERGPDTPVGEVMRPRPEAAGPDDPLERLVDRLSSGDATVVVVREDRPVGVVTRESIAALVAVRKALAARRP